MIVEISVTTETIHIRNVICSTQIAMHKQFAATFQAQWIHYGDCRNTVIGHCAHRTMSAASLCNCIAPTFLVIQDYWLHSGVSIMGPASWVEHEATAAMALNILNSPHSSYLENVANPLWLLLMWVVFAGYTHIHHARCQLATILLYQRGVLALDITSVFGVSLTYNRTKIILNTPQLSLNLAMRDRTTSCLVHLPALSH